MSEKEKDCNCSTEGNCENCLEVDHDQVTLTLDDGTEIVCDILAIFPCNEKEYIALLPTDGYENSEVFLYQFVAHSDDDIELIDIEDDGEFDAVTDAFDELLDSEEFDELYGDDDLDEESEDK